MSSSEQGIQSLTDVLLLLYSQKPEYSGYQFKGNGSQSLVIQAVKDDCMVALKIRGLDENDKKGTERIQREQNLLNMLTFCKYIVQVNNSFYLTKKKQQKDVEVYFVEEMELCDEDLSQYLLEFKKNQKPIDNDTKILMVIQMLDAINTLHQRNIMHRDIKPRNFLVSDKDQPLPTFKLCNLSFSSSLKDFNLISSTQGTPEYLSPEAADNKSRLESDLFSLGIIIIELDNTSSFDFGTVRQIELADLYQGNIFENHKINRNSVLYEIAQTFLQPQYQNRQTASWALFKLLKNTQNLKKLQLFSIVTLDQLTSESKFLPTQFEYQASIKALESQKGSDQSFQEGINNLIAKYKESYTCSFSIKEEQIQYVLKVLLSSGEFKDCEYLGVGASGLVFKIFNVKHNRQSVLKLCLCKNEKERAEKLAEAGLVRYCQMPYIIKFYGHQFIQDSKGTTFVIEEYEKCICTLSKYLEELKEAGKVLSEKQKMSIANQMMDSVNYLHEHSILHCDIKLDNYLVSSIEGEDIQIKLSDFDQSAYLDDDWFDDFEKQELKPQEILPPYNCLINPAKAGSSPFYAPERHLNTSQTTKQTDCFAVGLCVAILDNYMTFTEAYLCISYYSFFMDFFDDPFEQCEDKINKNSPLFPLILNLLQYSPLKRNSLGNSISKISESISQYSIPSIFPFSNQPPPHPTYLVIDLKKYPQFLNSIEKLTTLLNLNLNLFSSNASKLNVVSAENLSNALKPLTKLSNLDLNLRYNKLSELDVKKFSNALSALTNLSNLNLSLFSTKLGNVGIQYLSKALQTLPSLSNLNLNLRANNIDDDCIEYLSNALKPHINMTNLNLNLRQSNLSEIGAQYLSEAFLTLTTLSNLNLNLMNNQISDNGAQHLSRALQILPNLSNLNLNLAYNKISDIGIEYLSKGYKTLANLSNIYLNLRMNNLTDTSAEWLQIGLLELTNLLNLNLDLMDNSLTADGVEFLSFALLTLTKLSNFYLNLRNNKITDVGVNSLSNALQTLADLSNIRLNLYSSGLSADGGTYISNALKQLTKLSNLNINLSYNNLGDAGAEQLSTALEKLTNLSNFNLDLAYNNVNDTGAELISNAIKPLLHLQNPYLNFKFNNLSDAGTEYVLNVLKTKTNPQQSSFEQ